MPTPQGRGPLDPLSDVLRAVRLSGACFFRVEASVPWWAEVPDAGAIASSILPKAQHLVSYHVITEGRCWAGLVDGTGLWAETGDVVVVPHGDCYALSTSPRKVGDQPVEVSRGFFRQLAAGELPLTIRDGGGGPGGVSVICGFLGCDALPFNPILTCCRGSCSFPRRRAATVDRLGQLIEFALAESSERGAGSDCVLLRISELMFVEVLRRHVHGAAPGGEGLARGTPGSLRLPRPGAPPPGARPGVEPRRPGPGERPLTLGACGSLRSLRGPAAHAVPGAVEDAGGGPDALRRRLQGRSRGPGGRL